MSRQYGQLREVGSHALITKSGEFICRAFEIETGEPVVALVAVRKKSQSCLLRVQLACLYGHAFGSVDCDCGEQLTMSLDLLQRSGNGVLVYFPSRDGRGFGFRMKVILTEVEQELGVGPVTAAERCGIPYEDLECLAIVPEVLRLINVAPVVDVLTDNPEKIARLRSAGVVVRRVIPLIVDERHLSNVGRRELQEKASRTNTERFSDSRPDISPTALDDSDRLS